MLPYSQDLADKVCELIMDGYSLRKIEAIEGMPKRLNILKWLRENESFQTQYAHAREEQAECYADEIVTIADNTTDAAKARVQIDSRKWIASKLKAKKYGDSTQLRHANAEGGNLNVAAILGTISGDTSGLPRADEVADD